MKVKITEEVNFCDFCEKNRAYLRCGNCHKDMCYNCIQKCGKMFRAGWIDNKALCLCSNCAWKTLVNPPNEVFSAYFERERLREEYEKYTENFNKQMIAANNNFEKLY